MSTRPRRTVAQYVRLRIIAFFLRSFVAVGRVHAWWNARAIDGVSFQKVKIPSRDKGRTIKAYIYSPEHSQSTRPPPVHVNWHGSGFMLPSLGQDFLFCRELVNKTGAVVVDADYRKGPEFPFPAAHNDAEDVVRWVLSQASRFDTSKITLGGFSAGGNLALSAASSLGLLHVRAVAAVYPVTDFRPRTKRKHVPCANPRSGIALPRFFTRFFNDSLVIDPKDAVHPRLSVLLAPSQSFPGRVYIACGDGDTLYEDGRQLVEKLNQDGHPDAVFRRVHGEAHGWDRLTFDKDSKQSARDVYQAIAETIQRSWSDSKPHL